MLILKIQLFIHAYHSQNSFVMTLLSCHKKWLENTFEKIFFLLFGNVRYGCKIYASKTET